MNKLLQISLLVISFISMPSWAGGEIVANFNESINAFAQSPTGNVIYASTNDGTIDVIDMNTLWIIDRIHVGSLPARLAVDPEGQRLYVALKNVNQIAVIDLSSRSVVSTITLPAVPFDLEVANGYLYVTQNDYNIDLPGIMMINLATQQVAFFGDGISMYPPQGLLEISPDKHYLYFATYRSSPGLIAKYDITADHPVFMYPGPSGSFGNGGQDLELSADGRYLYYAVSDHNLPLTRYETAELTPAGSFPVDISPLKIAISPDGAVVYTAEGNYIGVWDANTSQPLTQYSVYGDGSPARDLIVDSSGHYLLAAFSSQLLIYRAESLQACLLDLQQKNTLIQQLNAQIVQKDARIQDLTSQIQQKDAQILQQSTLIGTLQTQLLDTDNDGVLDSTDKCPSTPSGTAVDAVGCSIVEFCAGFTAKNLCNSSDWSNDEPLGANDCGWQTSGASCRVK